MLQPKQRFTYKGVECIAGTVHSNGYTLCFTKDYVLGKKVLNSLSGPIRRDSSFFSGWHDFGTEDDRKTAALGIMEEGMYWFWATSKIDVTAGFSLIPNTTPMSNIAQYIQNIGKSKEDVNMLNAGLESPVGTPTADGLSAMAQLLYSKYRDELVDIVAKKVASEAKDKAK